MYSVHYHCRHRHVCVSRVILGFESIPTLVFVPSVLQCKLDKQQTIVIVNLLFSFFNFLLLCTVVMLLVVFAFCVKSMIWRMTVMIVLSDCVLRGTDPLHVGGPSRPSLAGGRGVF